MPLVAVPGMDYPQAFSSPTPPDLASSGGAGRARARSHHERDEVVGVIAGLPCEDAGLHHDRQKSYRSNDDVIVRMPGNNNNDDDDNVRPAIFGSAHRRMPSPPYPGIDTTAFDSGPGISSIEGNSSSANAAAATDYSGGGDSFLGFGFHAPPEELWDQQAGGGRGRARSSSYHEADGMDFAEAADASGMGCDLGWGDAAFPGAGDVGAGRGRAGDGEEEDPAQEASCRDDRDGR